MTTDEQTSREGLEQRALDAFEFLTTVMGSPPDVVRSPDRSHLLFVLDQVFVELEMDWREGAVFALVGPLFGGKPPSGYYVDDEGRRVRWHLTALLDECGRAEAARKLRNVTRRSGLDAMQHQIDTAAAVLRPVLNELPSLIHDLRSA